MSSWTARAAGAGGSHVAPGCHDQCAGVPLGEQGRAGKQVREERAGMCGITGWVDYRRDLTEERDIIAAMSATMECRGPDAGDRKSTRLNSSHITISYAVFCLKKK